MRPTITEQLDGLRRILSEVIAPEIQSPYPAEILAGVIATLDALQANWFAIPEYLDWESRTAWAILNDARPRLDPVLAAEVSALDMSATGDVRLLDDRQRCLSGLLVRAMPTILSDPDSAPCASMIAFFRARAARFPFAMAARPVRKDS